MSPSKTVFYDPRGLRPRYMPRIFAGIIPALAVSTTLFLLQTLLSQAFVGATILGIARETFIVVLAFAARVSSKRNRNPFIS